MKSIRIIELSVFAGLAAGLHVAVFGLIPQQAGAVSAGAQGDTLVSLEAADESVAEMVESWETVEAPQPEVSLPATPPQMQMPDISLPQMADAPPAPPKTAALETPKMPEMPDDLSQMPPETTEAPPPPPERFAPEQSARPKARPDRPKPAPKKTARPQQTQRDAPVREKASTSSAAQRAAGQGNRGAQGQQGQAKAATVSKAQSANLQAQWGAQIRQRIERRKRYPSAARGASGRVVVRVSVTRSGQLAGVSLAQSSGNGAIDQAAVQAVQRAGRFPAAPSGLGGASYSFSLPMTFQRR
ncbi:TonB family protein [Rhodobacteraceae bacterium]|nr:TonB family protein [Paracoccaceae bacterium]